MELQNGTIAVLKNFSLANQNLLFAAGSKLRTVSTNRSVLVEAVLNDVFPSKGAIFNLSRFLGALSLFDKPNLEFEDACVRILGDDRELKYFFAAETMIEPPPAKDIVGDTQLMSFDLQWSKFADLLKGASIMQFQMMVIAHDAETNAVHLVVCDNDVDIKEGKYSDLYQISIDGDEVDFCGDPGEQYVLRINHLKLLPIDYRVEVWKMKDNVFLKLCGKESDDYCEKITYWVATENR